MNIRRKDSEDQGGKWLLTFNDMVTLLLTFFVLILSLSKLDEPKVEKMSRSIKTAFASQRGPRDKVEVFTPFVVPMGNIAPMKIAPLVFEKDGGWDLAEHINSEAQRIARTFVVGARKGEILSWENIMEARVVEEGVSVALGENLLFETGSADIKAKDNPALKSLASILKKTDCLIRVEGNTDEIPINNERFPSNWELSTARAVNVVKYLISEASILPERLSAAGYADSRPRFPAVDDKSRKLNRRVEVLLIPDRNEGGLGNG
jgi:chemotaxis protein MotB